MIELDTRTVSMLRSGARSRQRSDCASERSMRTTDSHSPGRTADPCSLRRSARQSTADSVRQPSAPCRPSDFTTSDIHGRPSLFKPASTSRS